jgi:phosphatidylinositol glycan class S
MGQHRHGWSQFSDASVSTLPQLAQLLTLPAESTVHDQARLPSVTDFTLSFTLLNARPDGLWFGWDIEEAVQQYVTPFVTKILPVVTTTSDSQVLHFAGVSDRVQFDAKMQMHYITPEDLSRFVGGTKWNVVSPLVSNSVELMVYIPPVEQRPLLVREADRSFSASFIVPRWGGVAILNDVPASANCSGGTGACRVQISANELKGVMASLIAQLRVMIGLTPNEQVLRVPGVIEFLGAPAQGITDWELDALMRTKLLDNLVEVRKQLVSPS